MSGSCPAIQQLSWHYCAKGHFSCFANLPFLARLQSKGHCYAFVSCWGRFVKGNIILPSAVLKQRYLGYPKNACLSLVAFSLSCSRHARSIHASAHRFLQAPNKKLTHHGSVKKRFNCYHGYSRVQIWQGTKRGEKLSFTALEALWHTSQLAYMLPIMFASRHCYLL